jgi:hypothetical protein
MFALIVTCISTGRNTAAQTASKYVTVPAVIMLIEATAVTLL